MAGPIRYQSEPGGITYEIAPEELASVPGSIQQDPRFVDATRRAAVPAPAAPMSEPAAEPTQATAPMPRAAPVQPAEFTLAPSPQAQQAPVWRQGLPPPTPPPAPSATGEQLGLVPGSRPATLNWVPGEGIAPAEPSPGELPPVPGVPATEGAARLQVTGAAPGALTPERLPGRPAGTTSAAQRDMERAARLAEAAAVEAGVIGERVEAARAGSAEIRAQEARRAEAEQRALADAQRRAAQKAEADYQLALADMRTPAGEINPKRWWQNADTGQRIAAGLAAFLSGLSGGRNPIDTVIAQDIAAQQDQLDRMTASRREQMQGRLNLLGAMRARFGDEQSALAATKAAAFEAAAAEADKFAAQAAEGAAKVNARAQAADLRRKSAMALVELRQREAQTGAIRAQAELDRARLAAVTGPGGRALTEKERERLVSTPFGTIEALNKTAAGKLSAATEAFEKIQVAMDELIELRRRLGSEDMPSAEKRRMKQLATSVKLGVKEALNMGAAFTESEQAMVDEMTGGDPTGWGIGILAQMESFRGDLQGNYRRVYRLHTGQQAPEIPGEEPGSGARLGRPRERRTEVIFPPRDIYGPGQRPPTSAPAPAVQVHGIPAVRLPRGR